MKNKICALVLCSAVLGVSTAEAAYVSVTDATGNGSMVSALNLNSKFDQSFDANIGKFDTNRNNSTVTNISTTFFHASVNATTATAGAMDWYSFSIDNANVQAYFDIDNSTVGFNSWVKLYDSTGLMLASNNNRTAVDPGSETANGRDSYITSVLANPGLYYLSVGRALNGAQAPLRVGQGYTLHVSLANPPSEVPVPAAFWLFGSGLVGLLSLTGKKKA